MSLRKLFVCVGVAVVAALATLSAPGTAAARRGDKADFKIAENEEVRIGTWNIKFFYDHDTSDNNSQLAKEQSAPSKDKWNERVKVTAAAIAKMKPTLLGLQEIENKKVVEDLAKVLKDDHNLEYTVGFIKGTDTFTEQDVAFLAEKREGTVTYARVEDVADLGITNTNLFKIPSKHLALTVTHATPGGGTQRLTVIVVHLKAGGTADEPQRMRQARVLNKWATKLMTAGTGEGVIVLGDMNANKKFAQTSSADAMGVLRGFETNAVTDDMFDLNDRLDVADRRTHVSNKELDRIAVSPNLLDDHGLVFKKIENFRHLVVRGTGADQGGTFYTRPLAEADLSDHYPLLATFKYVP